MYKLTSNIEMQQSYFFSRSRPAKSGYIIKILYDNEWDVVIYVKTMQTTQKHIIISYSKDENWPP